MGSTPKTRREREVWEACDELWHELQLDQEPVTALTGERIRNKLLNLGYKRGNQNQIYQFRASWKENRGFEELDPPPDQKEVFSERVSQIVTYVMKEVYAEADQKIKEKEVACQRTVDEVKQVHQTLQQQIAVLEEAHSDLQEEQEQLQKQVTEAEKRLQAYERTEHELRVEKDSLIQQLKDTKQTHLQELERLEKANTHQIQSLEQQLQHSEARRLREQDEAKEYQEQYRQKVIVELDNYKEALRKKSDELKDQATSLKIITAEKNTLAKTTEDLQAELHHIQAESQEKEKRAGEQLATCQKDLYHEKQRCAGLEGQLAQSGAQCGRLEQQIERLQATIMEQNGELVVLRTEIKHLHKAKMQGKKEER